MLVPGHLVSLYVATSGASGANLGSDEKEIILLVYAIVDVQTARIVGYKQYLVRPAGPCGRDRSNSGSGTLNNNTGEIENANSTAPITDTLLQKAGKPLSEVVEDFDSYARSLSIDPNSPHFRIVTDGQLPLRQCLHPEACAKDIDLPSYYWRFCDLRKEFLRHSAGDLSMALVPVSDVNKLNNNNNNNNNNNLPSIPQVPASIAEMLSELDPTATQEIDTDFYIKESGDMVTIIQTLLKGGHKFEGVEAINLTLEPGICSIDDEIDGTCIVRARGLPWQSSDQDIAKFFRGLNVAKGGVALCLSQQGRRNGEALVRFISQEHRDMALKRHKHHIGNRYIEVYRATGEDFLSVAGGASNEAQAFLSKGAQVIIRMRGLPYDCTAKQVLEFFSSGENSCDVMDSVDGVLFVKKPDGRATGDAFVLFAQESDATIALSKHRESIGQRYIELFRSTTAEVQQVLNRSMDPKTYEPPQPPLIAQIPPVPQVPILPQHVITSGTDKSCIRLRGLPFEAKVDHILQFLGDDFAKHILYQGVHLIYNAQGHFNGEAFIQMDSEPVAHLCAQQRHHRYMLFGKKQRYIEVFQCSGEDMSMVLQGASFASQAAAAAAAANISKPPLLSPGGTMIGPPFPGFSPFAPPPTAIPLNGMTAKPDPRCPPTIINDQMIHLHPAFYPQPILYWGYPSPPVSPTTYYGPPPSAPGPHMQPGPPSHQPTLLPATTQVTSQSVDRLSNVVHQNLAPPQQAQMVNGQAAPQSPVASQQQQQAQQQQQQMPQITMSNGIMHSSPPSHMASPTSQPPQITYAPQPQYIMEAPQHDKILPRVLTPITQAQNQYVEFVIV